MHIVYLTLLLQLCKLQGQRYSGNLDQMNNIFLYHIHHKSKVLLIYDNVNDFDLLLRVLPSESSNLHILVTTRCCADHSLLQRADCVITLDYLSCDNALSALFGWANIARPVDEDELQYARKLVTSQLINGLPLAIAHIGTFIRQTNVSCCDYYEKLKSQEKEMKATALDIDKLLQYFHVSNLRSSLAAIRVNTPNQLMKLPSQMIYQVTNDPFDRPNLLLAQKWMKEANHVYLTWQFDIDSVCLNCPNAMTVLEFTSLLSSRNIPVRILQAMAFPADDGDASDNFSECRRELLSHTLISSVEMNACDVHALVQQTVWQRLMGQPDCLRDKLTRLARYLLKIFQNDQDTISSLKDGVFVELIPHLYSVANRIIATSCDSEECLDLLLETCAAAIAAGHYDVLFLLSEKTFEMMKALCSDLTAADWTVAEHENKDTNVGRYITCTCIYLFAIEGEVKVFLQDAVS